MAAASVREKAWREGDRCMAPDPTDGTLREATIRRLTTTSLSNDTTAWVTFTGHVEDMGVEEEPVPVSEITKPGLNSFAQEKPVFPCSVFRAQACVPLQLTPGHVSGEKVPHTINRYLRDYQREGIRFIYNNYVRTRGCILGDDMGLGKTVQVIGFLAAVLHKKGTWEDIESNRPQFLQSQMSSKQDKPNKFFLIVAPLSVLYNWKDELDTWGHFQCVVVHGLRKEDELARIRKGRVEIALTTYETLRLCLDQFNSIDWSAVIVDEVHKIKNPNSQITQAMKGLRCQVRIGLTGTILQNNLEELWCVMDWAIPKCLGSLGHFKSKFSDQIEQGQRHSATKRALATGRKAVRALARKISHWFLRRTKAMIQEQLPKKNDRVVYCSLTDFQQTVYQTVLDSEDVTLLLRSSEKCDCQSGRTRRRCCYDKNSEGVRVHELYFSYLAILRKVANHVALLQSTAGTSKKQEKYVSDICGKVFQKFPDFVQRCKTEAFESLSDPMYSGKMKVLKTLLKYYMQRRDKVLLFSLSTKLLDVLESYCMAEGLDYSRLDGATKAKERLQIVKEFNSCPHTNLCLVSTMAGGLGLNFVGANVVVLFDPTWNPANDLQAIDRAYRIGQCRDVTVLRLISLGTVEEIIYLRQIYKQQLQCSVVGKENARRYFEAVQGNDGHKGELFGIKNLFRLQTQGTCLTRTILEREGQVEAGVMTTSIRTDGEEQEEAKGVSESGRSSPVNVPIMNNQHNRGVLDFSSGSEDDEEQGVKRKAPDTTAKGARDGSSATVPGQMSLLQLGISRLLQRVRGEPGSGDGDSSPGKGGSVEESSTEEDGEDAGNKAEGSSSGIYKKSSTGNEPVHFPKSTTKTWHISSGSEREDGEDEDGGGQESLSLLKESGDAAKGWLRKNMIVNEKNDGSHKKKPYKLKATTPRVHQLQGYSDESEDLDIAAKTWTKKEPLNSYGKGGDGERGRLDYGRKRQSAGLRDLARSKYTGNIETFTSSEDEHTSVKRGRSTGCTLTAQRAGRSRADLPLVEQRAASTERRSTARRPEMPKAVSFTGLKCQTSPISKGNNGTIDCVLGGVQGVVYTHSNQHIVGGSKAEERISRAAVRDVFQLKMYSQLPANHLLGTQESQPDSPPLSATVWLEKPSVDHPVTFTNKSVHHTTNTTVIIGETPQAICRQQLEEMAAKFQIPSVHQFAEEVLRSTAAQRLAWLRQYYTSLNHPEVANTVTTNFPQPDSGKTSSPSSSSTKVLPQVGAAKSHTRAKTPQRNIPKFKKKTKCHQEDLEVQTEPRTPQNKVSMPPTKHTGPENYVPEPSEKPRNTQIVPKPHKKQKVTQRNLLKPLSDVPSSKSEEQEKTDCSARGQQRTKRGSVSTSVAFRADGGLGLDQGSSSGREPQEAAVFLDHRHRDTPSSLDVCSGWNTTLSKATAQGKEKKQEQNSSCKVSEIAQKHRNNPLMPATPEPALSTSSHHSLLTDLIGDTSILNDLLRPKSRGAQQRDSPTTASLSTVTLSAVSGSKGLIDSLSSPSSSRTASQQVTPPMQTSKGSRKDFWDILNEGNEESINRLTDLSEVQRVCVSTNLAARTRSREEEGNGGELWKTNKRFLWKK
ncbi:DNA excision repair protein ERCC-6-like 2 isoform X2 [Genypterus blacodes]|uniref:DNA excision repair protein ERCC-6-like 2 isoform X2 n=1 Tax=Genypterus blacodes TaxID=154954 RepID=UPI003F75959C